MKSYLIGVALALASTLIPFAASKCSKPPALFNFGDSNSDTGGFGALMATNLVYPNGRAFFHRPTGRFCDGRLILDFFAQDLNIGYVSPYLETLKPNFKNGANFALAGSTAMTGQSYCPFSLKFQLFEFLRFYNRSLQLRLEGDESLLEEEEFRNGLYLFDIGKNDLKIALDSITAYDQILERIQLFINSIRETMQAIYANGGTRFWIHNTGPLGCLPKVLSQRKPNSSQVDEHGFVASMNKAAQEFNSKLKTLCQQLRFELRNSTIVYVDVYAIKYKLIASAASYGFQQPFMACCGHGGPPYNWDPKIQCGGAGHNLCRQGAAAPLYINWDGVHYTEAANSVVAEMILSGNYSSPPLLLDFFC